MFEELLHTLLEGPNARLNNHKPLQVENLEGAIPITFIHTLHYVGALFSDGRLALLYHPQENTEVVKVDSLTGKYSDILYSPLLSFDQRYELAPIRTSGTSAYWTYHSFRTKDHMLLITWYGYSKNGEGWDQAVADLYELRQPLSAHQHLSLIQQAKAYNALSTREKLSIHQKIKARYDNDTHV